MINQPQPIAHDERGSTLIEVLVAVSLFAIIGLGVTKSSIVSLNLQKRTQVGNIAKNLAVSKAEELSGVQLDQLTDSYDGTENNLAVSGHTIKFKRVTNITVNADGSRSVDIIVSSTSPLLPHAVEYSTRFAPWES